MVGWQLISVLEQRGRPVDGFAPAGCPPPHAVAPDADAIRDLAGEALVAHLRRLGGLPQEVLDDPELLAAVLKTVRSDFAITKDYPVRRIDYRISCPVLALGGRDDLSVPNAVIARWSETTRAPATCRILPGGHFFHLDHPAEVGALLGGLCGPTATEAEAP
jgi:surfactin synthase thioesterase subunit